MSEWYETKTGIEIMEQSLLRAHNKVRAGIHWHLNDLADKIAHRVFEEHGEAAALTVEEVAAEYEWTYPPEPTLPNTPTPADHQDDESADHHQETS